MTAPSNFASFVGNARVVQILKRAVALGRVPHALIFAGPEGVGKKTLAVLLAKRLNCLTPEADDACGTCRSCRKIAASSHPDVRIIEPEGIFIRIDQVRSVIAEVAYHPFEGRFRSIIFDGAHHMRPEAANSLLKTLEEPPSETILVLVTTHPDLLLPTIRSRSQILNFTHIPQDRLAEHLIRRMGRAPADAQLAAVLSRGNLGAALAFDIAAHRDRRVQALRFVSLLLGKGLFAELSCLAAGIAKDRDEFLSWLGAVETVLQDVFYSHVAPGRIIQSDLSEDISALARRVSPAAVVSAIKAVRKLQRMVQYNVNRQIALESLFLAQVGGREWQPEVPPG